MRMQQGDRLFESEIEEEHAGEAPAPFEEIGKVPAEVPAEAAAPPAGEAPAPAPDPAP